MSAEHHKRLQQFLEYKEWWHVWDVDVEPVESYQLYMCVWEREQRFTVEQHCKNSRDSLCYYLCLSVSQWIVIWWLHHVFPSCGVAEGMTPADRLYYFGFGWENIQRLIQKWCSSFWADLWRALFTAVTSVWFPFGSIAAYHKLHIDNGDMVLMFVWSLIWSSFVEPGSCVVTANVRLTFYSGDVLNKKHDVEV